MSYLVLIVEDDEYNMRLATDVLIYHGFEVTQVFNGLNLITNALEHHPDIILMDISLKDTDGIQLTKALKNHPHLCKIPVVALTAHANIKTKEEIIEAGCCGYILKPIDIRTFPLQVKHYIQD